MKAIRLPTWRAIFKPKEKAESPHNLEKKYKLTEELTGRISDTP
jgi:hypothetical protein